MIKSFEEFVDNSRSIKENMNKLDFEPIAWGVKEFDDEAEDDLGIPVTITRFASGGRETIESYWKVYAIEDYDDSWNVKGICTESDDRRYRPGDEIEFEVYKDDNIWDIESDLSNALDDEGF